MGKRKVGALEKVEADLTALQYKIGRDPKAYKDDFDKQYSQYESQRNLFMLSPTSNTHSNVIGFPDLIELIAHVANCYPVVAKNFPQDLIALLNTHHKVLDPDLREKIVGSLVLLRRKSVITSSLLLQTLFPILVSTPSKTLRALLYQKILSDLRNSNSKGTDHALNRTFQSVLYNIVDTDKTSPKGIWAVKITRELWKRQIWTEAKAVSIMKEACLSENEKIVGAGVRFFLGSDKEREDAEDESSDDEAPSVGQVKHQIKINKKNNKAKKALESAVDKVKRKERKRKNQPHLLNFSALHLLHDPQGFAEEMFTKHLQNSKSKLNLEHKLEVLQLVSRLVGLHELTILSLYSYFFKYLTPRQPSVTSFLASLAQASHRLVPPDALEPLVQKIANEFVSEAAASEVASAGLNAIREICVRQPEAMSDTLLQDLVQYRRAKDKGVMMAARGLLSLYREVGAEKLKKRDRGREAALGLRSGERKTARFGETAAGQIEGLDLLEKYKEEQRAAKRIEKGLEPGEEDDEEDEDEDEGAWELDSDNDSDDSGGWIDVHSDSEIEISDSDDDKTTPKPKRQKTAAGETPVITAEENKENAAIKPIVEEEARLSTLATTRILTPADLIKLQELRLEASLNKALPAAQRKRLAQQAASQSNNHIDDAVTADRIEGLAALSHKNTKADKVAKAKEGKGERSEHKSTAAIRLSKKESRGKSTTNREKARKKNFMMTLSKGKAKAKQSLVARGRVLKAHTERQKRGGKRGNKGN